jgi:hypothetical protein
MRKPAAIAEGRLSPLDPLQFLLEGFLNVFRGSFAPGDAADVGTVHAEFFGYPAIQPPIQVVSLELRLFVMIRGHQW